MRIFILALGTRGDVELFVTLGRELLRRGHRVTLGTSAFHALLVQGAGIEWRQVGTGTKEELLSLLHSLASVDDKIERTRLYYRRWLKPQIAAFVAEATAFVAESDYFISGLKMTLKRGDKIMRGAAVTYDPPLDLHDLPKYGTQNHDGMILDLVAMNQQLVDPNRQWGEQFHFTGFWRAEMPGSERTPELARFLQDGPPPVVLALGSMVMFDSAKLTADVTMALRQAGQRGVIVGGWSELVADGTPDNAICSVQEAPYDWLFPRSACVIHHGGTGTLDAVLRAGKPSIVFPQIACQERFAAMLSRESLAAGVFDVWNLNPADLACAIQAAQTDKRLLQSADAWRTAVLADKGVQAAADLIEGHA